MNKNFNNAHDMAGEVTSRIEYIKFFGVITLIIIASYFMYVIYGVNGFEDYLRWLMGFTFLVFGIFKIIGYKHFVAMFPMYDILAKKIKTYAYLYPFIELIFAALYLLDAASFYIDVLALTVTSFGAIGIYKNIRSEGRIKCACLGNVIKLPLSKVSLFENLSMALMALLMIYIF